jgi:hypothetical protein
MANTPLKNLPLIAASQAQKHITHNDALMLMDALFDINVFSRVGVGGATPDATNRLSVNSPATLLNNAGASHEVTINKSALAKDAALAFKVAFSVRAIFGLLGSNDFTIKTSPDGSAFNDSLVARASDGIVSFPSGVLASGLTIEDDTDPTKKAQFLLSGITTGTTRVYTLPNVAGGTIALLSGNQTFGNTQTFNLLTATGVTQNLGTNTAASTVNIGTGATIAAATKAINIGTAGVSTSVTTVSIGSAVAGALGSTTINTPQLITGSADIYQKSLAPTNFAAAGTILAADIRNGIITYSGAAAALTVPTGTLLDAALVNMPVNTSIKFSVINTGTGAATMTAAAGVTIVGAAAIANGVSAMWEARKTAAATYVFYRIA